MDYNINMARHSYYLTKLQSAWTIGIPVNMRNVVDLSSGGCMTAKHHKLVWKLDPLSLVNVAVC